MQFEDRNLLSEYHNGTESGDKSDGDPTLPTLINEDEIDEMLSGNESDAELMSTDMLEDICDGSQYHPSINMREARYNIRDCIKKIQVE